MIFEIRLTYGSSGLLSTPERSVTISVFNGVPPTISLHDSEEEEKEFVAGWLSGRLLEGLRPHEIAIVVRSAAKIPRARAAAERAAVPFVILDDRMETRHDASPS